jgi:hypothetical protein
MDLTFIPLLRVPSNESQYAFPPRAAIGRGCSIEANLAQNCRLMSPDLKTRRVAIARFRMIRAGFNKRSRPAFPKADHRSDIRKRAAA